MIALRLSATANRFQSVSLSARGSPSKMRRCIPSLKAGMNQLAHGREPRFVEGDLLFKGEELLHATPASPVARLVFTMSAALPEGKKA
jgi:hypothetical protein